MKAKLLTFVRGLQTGTPPRFQSYLKSLTLLLVMIVGVGNVWGGTDPVMATLKITKSITSDGNLTDDKSGTWALTSDGEYTGSSSYIQVGTNKKSVTYIRLSTSAYAKKSISKIQVWGTSKASTNVTAKVYIGGTKIGESASAYSSQTAFSGGTELSVDNSENKSGDILVEISRPTSAVGAIYFNKLIVTYTEGSSTYSVTYDANNATSGSVPTDDTQYAKDATVTVKGNTGDLARTGYTWSGWNLKNDGSGTNYSANETFSISADTKLYAKWTPKTTTVTLNAPGATTAGTAQVTATYGQAMPTTSVTMPQWVGHTFNGFFDAETSGTKYYNANGTSAKNWDKEDATATLHAQWTIQTYNITYKDQNNANFSGTHASVYPTTHTYGTATTLDSPTKTGYTFAGWYENSDCTGSAVTTIAGDAKTAAFTLYAKWTANKYNVTFDKNNNDAEGTMAPQEFTFKVAANLNKNTFTLAHNTFLGWATTASGSKAYNDEASYTMSTDGATLYAKWATNQTTVTLDKQGGSGGNSSVKATYGQDMPSAGNLPTKTGYDFNGYYTQTNGQGVQYYSSTNGSLKKWDSDETTTTLYAYWTPKTISITLKQGEHGQADGSATIVYGTSTLINPTYVQPATGYTIDGYYNGTTQSATKVINVNGTLEKDVYQYTDADGNWSRGTDATLYAHFTPINYNVTWVANGKSWDGKGGSTTAAYNSKIAAVPTTLPESSDCDNSKVFVGWTATELLSAQDTKPSDLFNSASNAPDIKGAATYYAVFATPDGEPVQGTAKITSTDISGWTNMAYATTYEKTSADGTKWSIKGVYTAANSVDNLQMNSTSGRAITTPVFDANITSVEFNAKGKDITIYDASGNAISGKAQTLTSSATDYTIDMSDVEYKQIKIANKTSGTTNIYSLTVSYSSVNYLGYVTTCCTPLAAPASITATKMEAYALTFEWAAVDNAGGYEYKVGDGDSWTTWDGTNRSAKVESLDAGKSYNVSVRATGNGSYCAEGEIKTVSMTTLYTITAASNDQTKGTAKISTDGVNEATSIACAAGTKIYLHAHPVSAEYELSTWSTNSGTISSDKSYIEGWTENTTVTATFVAASIPSHNVNWSVNDVVTPESYKEGASITFGAPASIPEGYTFKGWTATPIATSQTTAPEYVTEATMGTADITYYAVFAKNVSGKQDEQYSFSEFTSSSSVELNSTSYTITLAGGGTNPAWVASVSEARLYAGGTMTIAAKNSAVISKVVYTYNVNANKSGYFPTVSSVAGNNSDAGTWNADTKTWETSTKAATSVVMTTTGSAGNLGFTSLTVTVGSEVLTYYTSIRTLQSILISGDVETKVYFEESVLDPTGLTVKAHYDKGEDVTLTSDVEWTFDPAVLSVGTTSCNVTATALEKTSEVKQITGLTVNAIPTYAITANAAEGGSYTLKIGDGEVINVPAAGGAYSSRAEKVITLTSAPNEGYKAHSTPFVVKDADEATVSVSKDGNNYTFTMPAKAVTITAQFVQQFNISTATLEHGSVASIKDNDGNDITATSKGSKVWVVFAPETGYSISAVTVTKTGTSETVATTVDPENPNGYSFTMPQSNVTVSATFAQINYTITLNNRGKETLIENKHYGDVYDFEVQTICPEYAFHGWTEVEPTSGTWATAPATVASYTVTASKTFYAVYKEEGEPVLTNNYKLIGSSELESGKNYLIVAYDNKKYYAVNNTFTDANYNNFGITQVTPSNDIVTGSDATKWKLSGSSKDGYTIYNATANKYMTVNDDSDVDFIAGSDNAEWWTLGFPNEEATGSKIVSIYSSLLSYSYPYLGVYNSHFETSSSVKDNYLYKQQTEPGYNYLAVPSCKELASVEVLTAPDKVNYKAGEDFDKTGLSLTATFTDASEELVEEDNIVIEGGEALAMSATEVTAKYTYDNITKSTSVAINMIELKSIAVNSGSAHKTTYKIGQTFNPAGLKLDATYNTQEGKTQLDPAVVEVVTTGFDYEPKTGLAEGTQEITITYGGKEVKFNVTVEQASAATVIFAASDDSQYMETETTVGAGVKVPTVNDCEDYTFLGWSETEIVTTSATQPELITITEGRYYPEEDVILYPVYKGLDGGNVFNLVTDLSTISSGDKVMLYSPYNSLYIAASSDDTYGCTKSTQSIPDDHSSVTLVDANTAWTVSVSNGNYQFYQGTKYLGVAEYAGLGSSVQLKLNSTYATWQVTASTSNSGYFTLNQASSTANYRHQVNYYSGHWSLFHNNAADAYNKSFRILKQGGSVIYTSAPSTCTVAIEQNDVMLFAGNGTIDEDEYTVLKGESLTLPTPEFDCNGWSFMGWSGTEIKREQGVAPSYVANPITPTKDTMLYAIYRRAESQVASGYVYKTPASCKTMVTISPASGNYTEAQTLTMTAGTGVQHIYYTDNNTYPMKKDGTPATNVKEYTEPITLTANDTIIAYAVYADGNSDFSFAKHTFTKPDAPTFSVAAGNVEKDSKVTISATEGNVWYKVGDSGEYQDGGSNSFEYTFNTAGSVKLYAKTIRGGLESAEVNRTYTVTQMWTVTMHAGTGLIEGEKTKQEIVAQGGYFNLPELDDPCDNGDTWKFIGWAASEISDQTSKPTLVGEDYGSYKRYYPESNIDLYAVYQKTQGVVELINEDFTSFSTITGSANFPTVSSVYDVSTTTHSIRLGASGGTGSIKSKVLNIPAGSTLNIQFDYKAWGGNAYADIKISEATNNVTFTGSGYTSFTTVTKTLTTTVANPQITIATVKNNDNRAYIGNVIITMGTPVIHYNTNPTCCVRTISFNVDGGEAIEPVIIPCGTGNYIALPEARKQDCFFDKWTAGGVDYAAGDVYEYASTRTDDVEFVAHYKQITSVTINKGETKNASAVIPLNYSGTVTVKDGAILMMDEENSVGTFIIESKQGSSGQVKGGMNLTITGDAYMELTIDTAAAGASFGWYAITVPFPVSGSNGIYYGDTKLKAEKDYSVMKYLGDVRAQGKYGWKKCHNETLQPGVFYLLAVADTDYKTLRFHLQKTGASYTIEAAATKGDGTTNSCRTNISEFASDVEADAGWNGVGNKTLEYVSVNDNGKIADELQTYDNSKKAFKTYASSDVTFSVGKPCFVQASGDGDFSFSSSNKDVVLAPARTAANASEKIKVTLSDNAYTDNLFISASEDALPQYEITRDLAKMAATGTVSVPQIATKNYGVDLCVEYAPLTNNEATYALSLFAPVNGNYTIAATQAAGYELFLTQNGAVIWNLSMGAYQANLVNGDNNSYGLVLKKLPSTPTDVNEVRSAEDGVQKFIYDEKLIIIREGQMYNAVGAILK